MIKKEDFETVDKFKIFIIDYLNRNDIFSKFVNNISKYPISCRDVNVYINYFYYNKRIKLYEFFVYSFNWMKSPEGDNYWYNIHKDFSIYITKQIYSDECWSD